ncbi:unnamed protein product [Tuber melanosporum]|uniref:(Perigord truffle) hypothetical protein n=1 Tax=Tuber melanosporum (strain Mel28) TaxID=656061 RepID=D5G4V5_TUBMM|nr:uncharacterized protein GSTUM_00000107001 [Tuber melanosporum]CAZ79548.1 unnamed protein product [Tuber melanosporum]
MFLYSCECTNKESIISNCGRDQPHSDCTKVAVPNIKISLGSLFQGFGRKVSLYRHPSITSTKYRDCPTSFS